MHDLPPLTARPVLALADLSDPAGTWARLCGWLHAGAATPTHAFRWPVLSTVAPDHAPDSRVVVLRRFDPAARLLVFHTDVRSAKVAHLWAEPRCSLLFYDPDDRVQLRVRAVAVVHHADPFARGEFDALPVFTRATYSGAGTPGAEQPADAPFDYPPKPPADEGVAFANFAAVGCEITATDALELHPTGHRRAVFDWPDGAVRMTRVGP